MKTMLKILVGIVLSFGLVLPANAGFTVDPVNDGVLYEDQNGLYWFKDLTRFTNMSYAAQIDEIADLNNPGNGYVDSRWGDWRMATPTDTSYIESYWHLSGKDPSDMPFVYTVCDGYLDFYYWIGRIDSPLTTNEGPAHEYLEARYASYAFVHKGNVLDSAASSTMGAWVVADAVPIPGAVWLLGSGLIGLVGLRKKFNKK